MIDAVLILIACYVLTFHVILPWMDRRAAKKETMANFKMQMDAIERAWRNSPHKDDWKKQ